MSNQAIDVTGFRLWLDTRYPVGPWPFSRAWRAVAADLPAELPGGVADFDVFLPEDDCNRTHGLIDREHAKTKTEMAVYRDGDALIVLMRLWDGAPLPERYARTQGEGAGILFMADIRGNESIYFGLDPTNGRASAVWGNMHVADSDDTHTYVPASNDAYESLAVKANGYWAAAFRIPLALVPGVEGNDPATLRFTAGRWWGETMEPTCWATSMTWGPRLEEMGWLLLRDEPSLAAPHLHRVDFVYDAAAENGELVFTLAGVKSGETCEVDTSVNVHPTHHTCSTAVRQRWTPENGSNAIEVKVAGGPPTVIWMEKWSGHQLFPRYTTRDPMPTMDELRLRFAAWHQRREREYVAPGTWAVNGRKDRYGVSHECAFEMEPYAIACRYLDDRDVYRQRVREACDRLLTLQLGDGMFVGYYDNGKPLPFVGGAFDHGSASEALVLGYRVLKDERYLEAAKRAAECYSNYPLENNTNYMAFGVWHLAELFDVTRERRYLDVALWYTKYAILRGLNPSGAHPGHNYYTAYGYITLKALAKLLRLLPHDDAFSSTLRERVIRFTNQMLSRQRANGLFDGLNRMFVGYHHTVPGLFDVARALPETAATLEPVLIHMLQGRLNVSSGGWTDRRPDAAVYSGLDVALMARLLHEKNTHKGAGR